MRRAVSDYRAYERSLIASAAAGGRAMQSLAEAHAALNLGELAGHQVLSKVMAGGADVTSAMGHVAAGHRVLAKLGQALGIDDSGFGDTQKPPSIDAA